MAKIKNISSQVDDGTSKTIENIARAQQQSSELNREIEGFLSRIARVLN